MKFFSTLKAERCLTQLLSERDPGTPEGRKALESLRSIGASANAYTTDDLEAAGAYAAFTDLSDEEGVWRAIWE